MKVPNWNELLKNDEFQAAIELIHTLESLDESGQALIVGGTVRDLSLGKRAKDIDIATNISIDLIVQKFDTVDIGKSKDFGIVLVKYKGYHFELAQYREDGSSSNMRHPDEIRIVSTFDEDSNRRDLTINAMGIDKNGNIIDHHRGMEDIQNKIVRAVGDPESRIREDALRILRIFRFSAVLGFTIDPDTDYACKTQAHLIKNIAKERVKDELYKVAVSGVYLNDFLCHIAQAGVFEYIFPSFTFVPSKIQNLQLSTSKNPTTNLAIMIHDLETYGPTCQCDNLKLKIEQVASSLKMSNKEHQHLIFLMLNHTSFKNPESVSKLKWVELFNDLLWAQLIEMVCACYYQNLSDVNRLIDIIVDTATRVNGDKGLDVRLKKVINGNILMKMLPAIEKKKISTTLQKAKEWVVEKEFDISTDELQSFVGSI